MPELKKPIERAFPNLGERAYIVVDPKGQGVNDCRWQIVMGTVSQLSLQSLDKGGKIYKVAYEYTDEYKRQNPGARHSGNTGAYTEDYVFKTLREALSFLEQTLFEIDG